MWKKKYDDELDCLNTENFLSKYLNLFYNITVKLMHKSENRT